jgi:hypothetical protein
MHKPFILITTIGLLLAGLITIRLSAKPANESSVTPVVTFDRPTTAWKNDRSDRAESIAHEFTAREISEIDIAVGTNVIPLVTDSVGKRTGKDPISGNVWQDIPKSAYFQDAIGDETEESAREISRIIQITHVGDGTYLIDLVGVRTGQYTSSIRAFSKDGTAQPPIVENGNIETGSRIRYAFNFTSTRDKASTLIKQSE